MRNHHPVEIKILFEDEHLIAINKPSGLLSVATDTERDMTAFRLVKDHLCYRNRRAQLFTLHRRFFCSRPAPVMASKLIIASGFYGLHIIIIRYLEHLMIFIHRQKMPSERREMQKRENGPPQRLNAPTTVYILHPITPSDIIFHHS